MNTLPVYQWNWAEFFRQPIQPPFVIDSQVTLSPRALLNLSFPQGLQVIVTSVPLFAHREWVAFQTYFVPLCKEHRHLEYWLMVGELIRDDLDEVRDLLNYDVEQALLLLQRLLAARDGMEQFALIACLYHHAQTSVQAQMMLQYVLQFGDVHAKQMQAMLDFYTSLTERQQEVAALTAQGMTNQEIAEALVIEVAVVAEHLTPIFSKFQQVIQYCPDKHGTRYRLIHWLTRLFVQYPYLPFMRKR